MSTITFKDTGETFEIMAHDERYIICQRPYTVQERDSEIKEWSDSLQNQLTEEYDADNRGYDSLDNFLEYCLEVEEIEQNHRQENGSCPEEIEKDTFCYTIVDLQTKKRAPDNYYCKFNYDKKEECEIALKELNSGEMQLSRRRSIELSEYEIKEEPYISGFEVEM